jgi:hypothetical protein
VAGSVEVAEISPGELRYLLESEARLLSERLRASQKPVVPAAVAGAVLERHQALAIVRVRVSWLWRHLEQFVAEGC